MYNYIMNKLTESEARTLVQIFLFAEEQRANGIALPEPPSVRQLMPLIGVKSTSAVIFRIRKLHDKGLLAGQSRSHGCVTRLTDSGIRKARSLARG